MECPKCEAEAVDVTTNSDDVAQFACPSCGHAFPAPEYCGQCGDLVVGHHACEGVPGGFGDD